MTTIYYWKVHCDTESSDKYVWSSSQPTTCPVNKDHVIDELKTVYTTSLYAETVYSNMSPYTVKYRMKYIICDTTDGNITLNLRKAAYFNSDFPIIIVKPSALNTLTIDTFGNELINSLASKDITAEGSYKITSNGSSWTMLDNNSEQDFDPPVSKDIVDVNTKGQILVDTGTGFDPLKVGLNNQVLTADSTTFEGMKWATPSHGNLADIGTNTHSQIDTHITIATNHIATATAHGATGAVMGTTNAQTVTNKTLTSTSNNIAAKSLHSATTMVNTSAAAAPVAGQVLTATSSTSASWQNPTGGSGETRELALVKATVPAGYKLTTTHENMVFSTTEISTDAQTLEHNSTDKDRIDIKVAGQYEITFACTHNTTSLWNQLEGRLILNNSTVISGSEIDAGGYASGSSRIRSGISHTVVANLSADDYITVQYKVVGACNTLFTSSICVKKLDGVVGPAGPTGAPGDITWMNSWDNSTNYMINHAVSHNGTSYVCVANHLNQEPPNATYWDVLASKGDQGVQGIQGIQGEIGLIDWQGAWSAQNYTADQSVSYNGSCYICKLNTVSNEPPTDTTYWDLLASKGDTGTPGAGSSIIIKNNNVAIANTPHTELDFTGSAFAISNAGSGRVTITRHSRYCDYYYKPAAQITVSTSDNFKDIPMNVERIATADFTHASNSPEITIVSSDIYEIKARLSSYYFGSTQSSGQFALFRNTGAGYSQIEGTLAYDHFVGYNSGARYNTGSTWARMQLNAGDKIKLQYDVISGGPITIVSQGAGISINNI